MTNLARNLVGGANAKLFVASQRHSRQRCRHLMPRPRVLVRLLEHGALDVTELREVTGWTARVLATALYQQAQLGRITWHTLNGRRYYCLPETLP